MQLNDKIIIAIPTYNEKLNVSSLVLEILSLYQEVHIIVIDDSSPDGTEKILRLIESKHDRFKLIIRPGKSGVGSAHKHAIKYAKENDYQYLVTMDADYTHQPEDIQRFLDKIESTDIVTGSRFSSTDGVKDWNIHRKIMTKMGHFLTKSSLKMPYDASGAFRCYNLKNLNLDFSVI